MTEKARIGQTRCDKRFAQVEERLSHLERSLDEHRDWEALSKGGVEEVLKQSPLVPNDVWIGTNSAADKVTWLLRRIEGMEAVRSKDIKFAADKLEMMRERVTKLEKVLRDIKEFACAHHSGEIASLWLHSLLVDIPQMVNDCLQDPEAEE